MNSPGVKERKVGSQKSNAQLWNHVSFKASASRQDPIPFTEVSRFWGRHLTYYNYEPVVAQRIAGVL